MTPTKLRQLADDTDQRALRMAEAGDIKGAAALSALAESYREVAAEQDGLRPRESSGNLRSMDAAQLARRGKAIAKGKAKGTRDALWKAILGSKWGSQERYARERLGISPPSLSAYRSGATNVPRSVAAKVLADFGIGDDYWPKPVVD